MMIWHQSGCDSDIKQCKSAISLRGSAVSTLFVFPQMSFFCHAPALSLSFHSSCCFSHCSSLMRWRVCGVRSAAGWDDSRACFSLWVYYLCSGPLKTTQSGPGAQCGESVLTHWTSASQLQSSRANALHILHVSLM